MNITRIVLSTLLVGQLLNATESIETFVGLGEQVNQFYNNKFRIEVLDNCPNCESIGVCSHYYPYSTYTIITIQDFERSVFAAVQNIRQGSPVMMESRMIELFQNIKGFLIFLEISGDRLKNHDEIIFDTQAIKWSKYRDANTGYYNFDSGNYLDFQQNIIDIIRFSEQTYKISESNK